MTATCSFQSHPVYDREDAIVKTGNTPSPVDLALWQERINGIVGLTVSNQPRIRIVWGQDLQKARHLIDGRWRATYPFYRYQAGDEIHDIGTPRFFVEELHEVSELGAADNWERARYLRHPETGMVEMDVLGPLPVDGYYTLLFQIAHHDGLCCGGAGHVKGVRCDGGFRPPSELDLRRIRRMHQRREQASRDESAPSPELVAKRTADAITQRDEDRRLHVRAAIDDFMKSHGWRFTEADAGRLAHGRFHFLSGNKTPALLKDNLNDSNSSSTGANRPASNG